MSIYLVKVPQMGEGLRNVKIIDLLKRPGEIILEDEIIYSMETDKSIVEIESPVHGELIEWTVNQGDKIDIGEIIAKIKIISQDLKYVSNDNKLQKEVSLNLLKNIESEDKVLYRNIEIGMQQRTLIKRFRKSTEVVIPISVNFKINLNLIIKIYNILTKKYNKQKFSIFILFSYIIIRACENLPKFRSIILNDKKIREYSNINLGVAVNTYNATLVSACLENANIYNFTNFIEKLVDCINRARRGEDQASQIIPNIVLSYINKSKILYATPILVSPSVATIFINLPDIKIKEKCKFSRLSATFDHRLINGVDIDEFINKIYDTINLIYNQIQDI